MKISPPYLKRHRNGVYYIHWTEGRIGKRRTTKTRNRAEAEKRFKEAKGGSSDPRRPKVTQAPAPSKVDHPSGTKIVYADDEELRAIRADPVGYRLKELVAARSKLSVLMLRYENAVLTNGPGTKLNVLMTQIIIARADLCREQSFFRDRKAMAAGEPLAPPDCDSILWPRRPGQKNDD